MEFIKIACPKCKGTGTRNVRVNANGMCKGIPVGYTEEEVPCNICKGEGWVNSGYRYRKLKKHLRSKNE